MITDEQIEEYLFRFTKNQTEFTTEVLRIITERMYSVGRLASFDALNTIEQSTRTTTDITKIKTRTKKFQQDQEDELEEVMWELLALLYAEALMIFDEELRLQDNAEVLQAFNKSKDEAKQSLRTMLKNPSFIMRDLKQPAVKRAYSLEEAYKSGVAEASLYINLPDPLFEPALKRTTMQLLDGGMRYKIDNSSENAHDAKSANKSVRLNVLDSMRKMLSSVDKVIRKQFGGDAVQLSAHFAPAPDHAPAQGHIFLNAEFDKMQNGEDFTDVDGITYEGFDRAIGEWNCRHYVMSCKSTSKPEYTQEELDEILRNNEKGYTDESGKHYTLYECTQIQRGYERAIRKAKEQYIVGKSINNKSMMQSSRAKVGNLTTQYKQFSRKCDLPAKLERVKVKDYQ